MADGGHRRSARISALEEKARALALERKAKAKATVITAPKRRGPKRKSLHDMEEESENYETAWNQPLQEMPSKVVLEFILDLIMQRKYPMFAQPSDPDQVKDNQGNVSDLKDFGTIRVKIREGMYTSMAQFERDVSLITKNSVNFSSAAMFLSEARTISELADRLFSPLRIEPEKFASEDSQKRSNGNKLLGEAIKNAKLRNAVLITDPFLKRTNYFASSSQTTGPSGSRKGGQLKFYDKRSTYMPQTPSKRKNESVLSLELKEPKILELAPQSDGAYIKSYLSYLSGLGPKVKHFGSKKLTKSLNEASPFQRCTNVSSAKPYTYLRGTHAGPILQEPPHQRGRNGGLLHPNFILEPESSYRVKPIAVEGRMNSNCQPWERPQAINGGSGNSFFLREMMGVGTSKNMDFNNSSSESGEDVNNHLLFATLWHDNSPDIYSSSESSHIPPSDCGRFPNVLPSKMIESGNFPLQSPSSATALPGIDILYSKGKAPMTTITPTAGMENYKHPQPASSRNIWYESIDASRGLGFNFMDPSGEGASNTSAFSPEKYSFKSSQDVQTREWNRAATWGLQTTFDSPNLEAQVIDHNLQPRYSFMQLLQGVPQEQDFLDEISFSELTDPQGHRALVNSLSYRDGTQSLPIDVELDERPDLNLQL